MPPLLTPSPIILDQSFPRDENELREVAWALGEIVGYLERDDIHLLLTETLRDFVEDTSIEWNQAPGPQGILREIYNLFSQWFLQRHSRLIEIDVSQVDNYSAHPIPQRCENQGMIELWSDELGRILAIHDTCCDRDSFFIGVTCSSAFAGSNLTGYTRQADERCFPMVGPNNLETLSDAYEWELPHDMHRRSVSFASAKKNCRVIGAKNVRDPSSGSHYIVEFDGQRSWPLDINTDPIPKRFLKQLISITKYPLEVIQFALVTGEMPKQVLKFTRSQQYRHCVVTIL